MGRPKIYKKMKKKQPKILINTLTNCFLCFSEVINPEGTKYCGSYFAEDRQDSHSIQNVLRYIKLNLGDLESFKHRSPTFLLKAEVKVSLCPECKLEVEKFSNLYKDLEVIKMKLDFSVKKIHGKMDNERSSLSFFKYCKEINDKSAEKSLFNPETRLLNSMKDLRDELIKKCKGNVRKSCPRVHLLKMTEERLKLLPHKFGPRYFKTLTTTLTDPTTEETETEERQQSDPVPLPIPVKYDEIPSSDNAAVEIKKEVTSSSSEELPVKRKRGRKRKKALLPKIKNPDWRKIGNRRIPSGKPGFKCHLCERRYEHQSNLYRHFRQVHKVTSSGAPANPETINFPCSICKKVLGSKANLRYHMYSHSGARPYKCKICSRRFRDPNILIRHSRTHATELEPGTSLDENLVKYTCEICGKVLVSKQSLTYHLKTHDIDPRIYQCSVCPAKFMSDTKLRNHSKLHLEEIA